jgi:hypothetical protein
MTATAAPSTSSSAARAEASRRNGARSKGPTSQAGKDKSRFNALKHGMRAKLPLFPGEDGNAFQARFDSWTKTLEPRDDVERYLVQRAVNVSWQLDRADRAWAARLRCDLISAGAEEAAAQADEVILLGSRLFWDPRGPIFTYPHWEATIGDPIPISWSRDIEDPNEPARVLNRLESTMLGCAWLLDRWGELRTILEEGLKWQPPDRFKAIRLLGKQPTDATSDARIMGLYLACWSMEPEVKHPFADVTYELDVAERKRFVERMEGREAWERTPTSAEAGLAELLELITEQEERLEKALALHLERESAAAGDRLGFEDTEAGERLRRYQLACNRTLMRILETLRKRRRTSGKTQPLPAATDSSGPLIPVDECPPVSDVAEIAEPAAAEIAPEIERFPEETGVEGRNSKNEPIGPAGAVGSGVPDALVALLSLIKMAVGGLLWAFSPVLWVAWAVKKLPQTVITRPASRCLRPIPVVASPSPFRRGRHSAPRVGNK